MSYTVGRVVHIGPVPVAWDDADVENSSLGKTIALVPPGTVVVRAWFEATTQWEIGVDQQGEVFLALGPQEGDLSDLWTVTAYPIHQSIVAQGSDSVRAEISPADQPWVTAAFAVVPARIAFFVSAPDLSAGEGNVYAVIAELE